MTRVTVLGLGIMGSGIAHNILKAGHPLTVYNRTKEKAASLIEAGARWADSPSLAAQHADVVISMVGDDIASRAVWLGESGAFSTMPTHSHRRGMQHAVIGLDSRVARGRCRSQPEIDRVTSDGQQTRSRSRHIDAAHRRGRGCARQGPTGSRDLRKKHRAFWSAHFRHALQIDQQPAGSPPAAGFERGTGHGRTDMTPNLGGSLH